MKFAFSTLGCPNWSFEDIISTAKDIGFDGVELRGVANEIYIPHIKQFVPQNIQKTMDVLKRMKLDISCLSSDCRLNERFRVDDHMRCAKEYIDVAGAAGIGYVRVLADTAPGPTAHVDADVVAKDFKTLAEYAKPHGVTILIETNGMFAHSGEMLNLIELIATDNVGVLWDVHHPFRFFNEPIDLTYKRLKDYIRYVHVKDSLVEGDEVKYQMMGYGDVPVPETIALLRENGYTGYVSLEWLKRWCSDLAEPGIVFPHFYNYVKAL